jgi:putative flippase GtrA
MPNQARPLYSLDMTFSGSTLFDRDRYLAMLGNMDGWRLFRFGFMGIVTFALQLGLLMAFKEIGLPSVPAYALALMLAVQFNFIVNLLFVWGDRPISVFLSRAMAERWLTFHGCIALSLVLNFGGFVVAQMFMSDLPATAVGVGLSTIVKFFSLDRVAFREGA